MRWTKSAFGARMGLSVSGQGMLGGSWGPRRGRVGRRPGYGIGAMGVLIPRMREGWGGWIGARVFKGGFGWTISWLIWLMRNMGEEV